MNINPTFIKHDFRQQFLFCNTFLTKKRISEPQVSKFRIKSRYKTWPGNKPEKMLKFAASVPKKIQNGVSYQPKINEHGTPRCSRGPKMVPQVAKMEAPSPPKWQPRGAKRQAGEGVALKMRHCQNLDGTQAHPKFGSLKTQSEFLTIPVGGVRGSTWSWAISWPPTL